MGNKSQRGDLAYKLTCSTIYFFYRHLDPPTFAPPPTSSRWSSVAGHSPLAALPVSSSTTYAYQPMSLTHLRKPMSIAAAAVTHSH